MVAAARSPQSHGERVITPARSEWIDLMRANARAAGAWTFEVGGRDARELRAEARGVALAQAQAYTTSLGIPGISDVAGPEFIVVTGHQPELFHPGVWAKYLLMREFVAETGATGVDLVVDTDTYTSLSATLPCAGEVTGRCEHPLAESASGRTYAGAAVPSDGEIERFCGDVRDLLDPRLAPGVRGNSARFCEALNEAASFAEDLSGFMTAARRRYEGTGSAYLELPVTRLAAGRPFRAFVTDICTNAERFAIAHNAELAEYRTRRRLRSVAQPFPDLRTGPGGTEVPFWLVHSGMREPASVTWNGSRVRLFSASMSVESSAESDAVVRALDEAGVLVAPRAVALTLFVRTFIADLFIHGTGGARYDEITDGVAKRYWGVSLPPHGVVSLTMHLAPTESRSDPARLAHLERTLERAVHNPDEYLGEIDAQSDAAGDAERLRAEKLDLVQRIAQPGADKKALGMRIKEINTVLGRMLEAFIMQVREERDALTREIAAESVLRDRTYPYFLWSADEVSAALE